MADPWQVVVILSGEESIDGIRTYKDWGAAADAMVDEDGIFYAPVLHMFEITPKGIENYMDSDEAGLWARDQARKWDNERRFIGNGPNRWR